MPYVAAQLIAIDYNKPHRGGEGAAARVHAGRAEPLPHLDGDDVDGILHERALWMGRPPHDTTRAIRWRDGELTIGKAFRIHLEDELVIVPEPGAEVWKTRPLARIARGAWARVRWNEIQRGYEDRWFRELVLNIGLFKGPPGHGVFFGEPTVEHDRRFDLLRNGSRAE
jgi:hypothetical protein